MHSKTLLSILAAAATATAIAGVVPAGAQVPVTPVAISPCAFASQLNPNLNVVTGGSGPDVLDGTSKRDIIIGGDGNDLLRGYGADDILCGDRGNDVVLPGAPPTLRAAVRAALRSVPAG